MFTLAVGFSLRIISTAIYYSSWGCGGSRQISPSVHSQQLSTFIKEAHPGERQIDVGYFRGCAQLSHITQRPVVHRHGWAGQPPVQRGPAGTGHMMLIALLGHCELHMWTPCLGKLGEAGSKQAQRSLPLCCTFKSSQWYGCRKSQCRASAVFPNLKEIRVSIYNFLMSATC